MDEIVPENDQDSPNQEQPPNPSKQLHESNLRNDALLTELESLRVSYAEVHSRTVAMEESLFELRRERDQALKQSLDFGREIEEVSKERDDIKRKILQVEVSARGREEGICRERDEVRRKVQEVEFCAKEREEELVKERDEEERGKLEFRGKFEACQGRVLELEEVIRKRDRVFWGSLDSIRSVKECLQWIVERMDEEKSERVEEGGGESMGVERMDEEVEGLDEESRRFLGEVVGVDKLANLAEDKFREYEEMRKKERRELGNSVVSLTEENRDINTLLRVAIVEKEAVEKALNRLKGGGEARRVPLLQYAERGLQRFGFMVSAPVGDSVDNSGSGSDMCAKSEHSESEDEIVSLASTVEQIMKNLRLEITQLKLSLDESRSDSERLQSLTEKQAQKIDECTLYIKDLEERESRLAENIEQLMMEITGADEEIARWREACEMEVEAGKSVIEEREREKLIIHPRPGFFEDSSNKTKNLFISKVTVLKEELNKTKATIEMLNNKVKLKEELAAAAMAAQEAAEKSLKLADRRAAELRERIEELTRQLDEADNRGEKNNRRKIRHICWPWLALKSNTIDTRSRGNVKRMIPEMQGLLHNNI